MSQYNLRALPSLQPAKHTDHSAGGPFLVPPHILTTEAGSRGTIRIGRVVSAIPYLQVYKIVTGEGPPIIATPLRWGGTGQTGVVSTQTYMPGDFVAVLCHSAFPHGFILGCIPLGRVSGLPIPDKLSIIGFDFYNSIWSPLAAALKYPDLSGRMFSDASGVEQGFSAVSGMAITIDPFLAQVRYDEATGLFVFAVDRLVRISGKTYQEWSAAHERTGWTDSDLACLYEGVNLTTGELCGAYQGATYLEDKTDTYKVWEAPVDCVDFGQFPFHRFQQYTGALGFFRRSFLVAPPVWSLGSLHKYSTIDDSSSSGEPEPNNEIGYTGLYDEFLGVDGFYCARSAAGFGWLKTPIISAPRRKLRINSTTLKLNEPYRPFPRDATTGEFKSVSYALTTWDVLLHSFVWFGSQNFIHGGDFACADEFYYFDQNFTDQGWRQVMELKGLEDLKTGKFMPPPDMAYVNVLDSKDGVVFNSVSYISMLPDGAITIGDGYGSEIVMAGGKIFIDAPGGVFLRSGREVALLAGGDIIATAANSIDITANTDTRMAAGANLHLAGALYGGAHGVLIESRSAGDDPSWFFNDDPEAVGENTTIGGIRLLCPSHVISAYSSNIHMVAHGGYHGGEIRLEACGIEPNRDNGRVVLVGDTVNHHVDCAVIFRYPAYQKDNNDPVVYFAARDRFIVPVKQITKTVKCDKIDQSGFAEGDYIDIVNTVKRAVSAVHPNAYDDIKTYKVCFTFRSANQMRTKRIELIKPRWYRLARRSIHSAESVGSRPMGISILLPKPTISYPGYDPTGWAAPKEYDQDNTILEDENTAKSPPESGAGPATAETISIQFTREPKIYIV